MRSLYIQYECCQNILLGADDIQCCISLYAITPNLVLSESLKITWLHGCFNSSFSFSTDVTAQQTPQILLSQSYSVYKQSHAIAWDEEILYFIGLPKAFIYRYSIFPSEKYPPPHTQNHWQVGIVGPYCSEVLFLTRHQPNTSSAVNHDSHLEALKLCLIFFLRQLTTNSRQSAWF